MICLECMVDLTQAYNLRKKICKNEYNYFSSKRRASSTPPNYDSRKDTQAYTTLESELEQYTLVNRQQEETGATEILVVEDSSSDCESLCIDLVSPLKDFTCEICHKGFTTQNSLKLHKNCTHKRHKTFKCDKCGSMYKYKRNLRQHLEHHDRKPRTNFQ